MTCKNCGREVNASDNFCTACGAKIEVLEEINEQILNEECSQDDETKFEKFMSKHFFKNLPVNNLKELSMASTAMSVMMVLLQFIKLISIPLDFSTSFLFAGEIICILSDWYFLSKMGIRGKWKIWGLFFYPVYLFLKAKKTNKKYLWSIICTVIVVVVFVLAFVDMTDGNVGYKEADFGITVDEYIANVESEGISVTFGGETTLDDGGVVYIYHNGERQIWIYTRLNGNVFRVAFVSSEYEYGVNQVSTIIIKMAARLFAATEVSESSNTLYSSIYECILEGGAGASLQLEDCVVTYSRTLVEYQEVAWIEAK